MQKHNPFVYYDDVRNDPAQLASVVPPTQLAADIAAAQSTPAFGSITPNIACASRLPLGGGYNHYSLLRTIEVAWGLAPLTADDARAPVMSDFFAAP
jgi:hypothetical protein